MKTPDKPTKPCRLDFRSTAMPGGPRPAESEAAWKFLAVFDAANEDATDAIMNAAQALAEALNDPACGRHTWVSLMIGSDEVNQQPLMVWTQERGLWVDAAGEPA